MTKHFPFITLVVTAIFSCWLLWHYVLTLQWEAPGNPNNPDQFAYNLEVNTMDENGKPQYYFSSPHLLHYVTNDRTAFEKPIIKMFEQDEPPWIMHSDQGEAMWGNNQITLWGNVNVTQATGKTNVSSVIKTTKVLVFPKKHLVTSDQYISAVQPNASVNSVGMVLDLTQKTLYLLSKVQGVYVSTKQ